MRIISGKIKSAKKVVVYGPEGIGKSTFASKFPSPVFIDTEGSTKDMDVDRFEKASSWTMLLEQVKYVRSHPDICKTLVIDTADWAEQMCVQHICDKAGKSGIEDFGYGNGYVYAKEEFGRFLNLLEDVVDCGINVVLTAHAHLKKFEQPDEMGAYDRWEMKLGKKTSSQTAPIVKEWADMVLFANYETQVYNVDGQGAQKGKNKAKGGKRVMYTSHHPCWDAKNRYGLAEKVPFDYSEISHIIDDVTHGKSSDTKPVEKSAERASAKQPAESTIPKEPEEKKKTENAMDQKQESMNKPEIDPGIPKALRDLMEANNVIEWDIQNVVAARGYYPADVPVKDYENDFIHGVLVAAWKDVYAMIKDMKEKEEIPFN